MELTFCSLRRLIPCFRRSGLLRRHPPIQNRCVRFYSDHGESYFNEADREQILQQAKYKKREGQKVVSLDDITIPQPEIRKFIQLVHPDRFQSIVNESNENDSPYTSEQVRMMQHVNQNNLSTLNSILQFSKKHSKMIHSELSKDKSSDNTIGDRKLTQNAPNPANFEFYVEKSIDLDNENTNGKYFEHIHVKFECSETRPLISEYYKTLNNTLNELFRCCDIEISQSSQNIKSSKDSVKKFSDLDIDKAVKMANNGDEEAQKEVDQVFEQHFSEQNRQRNKYYGVNAMRYKFENKKIFFAPSLNEEQIEAVMDTLYKVSSEFAIDLVFDLWMEVPIFVCLHEMECIKCPKYVVAIPWYCDTEEFVMYIQEEIVKISKNYKKQKDKMSAV